MNGVSTGQPRSERRVSYAYPSRSRRAQGFTLVEVLVAVLVLAVGLLGLAGLQLTGMKTNDSAERRMRATVAVQDVLERMRISPADFTEEDQYWGQTTETTPEFDAWVEYWNALDMPEPTDTPDNRARVNCDPGSDENECGDGNCDVSVTWDDSFGDRKAQELGDQDVRDLGNMTVRVCSRIAEAL